MIIYSCILNAKYVNIVTSFIYSIPDINLFNIVQLCVTLHINLYNIVQLCVILHISMM